MPMSNTMPPTGKYMGKFQGLRDPVGGGGGEG